MQRIRTLKVYQRTAATAVLLGLFSAAPTRVQDTAPLPPAMVEVLTAVAASHDARALDSLVQYLQQTHPEAQAAIAEWVARRNRAVWLAALDSRLSSRLKARLSYTLQHEAGSGVARTLTDTTSRLTLLYGF